MITKAKTSLYFAEFYFHLSDGKNYLTAGGQEGLDIYNEIIAAHKRGVQIYMVVQKPSASMPNEDAIYYNKNGIAKVVFIDWSSILSYGILHTKMIIADNSSFYVGSANTDWESLTQVKELGIYIKNNPNLAGDAIKIFYSYWVAANGGKLPKPWPSNLYASFNFTKPQQIISQNYVYFSVSPKEYATPYRNDDLETLLRTIKTAKRSVCIEVMDYFPGTLYVKENFYWPDIDDKLRDAAFRGVHVRFLVSKWNHSKSEMFQYLKSLNQINNIQVKLFELEEWSPPIPFTRVNHAKFMVTENKAFISTSNWSGDYFLWTGGVSVNWEGDEVVSELQRAFDRDWNSPYAKLITL